MSISSRRKTKAVFSCFHVFPFLKFKGQKVVTAWPVSHLSGSTADVQPTTTFRPRRLEKTALTPMLLYDILSQQAVLHFSHSFRFSSSRVALPLTSKSSNLTAILYHFTMTPLLVFWSSRNFTNRRLQISFDFLGIVIKTIPRYKSGFAGWMLRFRDDLT